MSTPEHQPARTYPPFWFRLSVTNGNLLQIAGMLAGGGLVALAGSPDLNGLLRFALMLLGALLIYCCCHSLGHWLVGRLLGIRFSGCGVRGTNHPQDLGPVLRAILTRLPMFTVMTEKSSMERARPLAKALMFAAGETSTIICVLSLGFYAWQTGVPGGLLWFIVALLMCADALISTSRMPTGDYARARRALRGN
ncbi:MAG: hypothetical protein U0694_16495 [Anaerolineae bacterium]